MKLHVKKGDTVIILSGNEKGKSGKILEAFPRMGLVVVEGIGMRKKHQKSRREGQSGQIIDKRQAIHASKVMEMTLYKERMKKAPRRIEKK